MGAAVFYAKQRRASGGFATIHIEVVVIGRDEPNGRLCHRHAKHLVECRDTLSHKTNPILPYRPHPSSHNRAQRGRATTPLQLCAHVVVYDQQLVNPVSPAISRTATET